MENNDKITQLYYGEVHQLFSEGASDEAWARVHWICEKTEGKKVINIGCSQGIVSIRGTRC